MLNCFTVYFDGGDLGQPKEAVILKLSDIITKLHMSAYASVTRYI